MKKIIASLLVIAYFSTVTYIYFAPISLERFGTNADKVFHFLVFFCGGIVFILLNLLKISLRYEVMLLASLFVTPLLLEMAQGVVSYRVYDPMDMFYNYAGLGTVLVPFAVYLLIRKVIYDKRNDF
jgi:VanZ family protein